MGHTYMDHNYNGHEYIRRTLIGTQDSELDKVIVVWAACNSGVGTQDSELDNWLLSQPPRAKKPLILVIGYD